MEREDEKSTEVSTEVEREEAQSTEARARVSTVERSRLGCRRTRRGRGDHEGAHFRWAGRRIRPGSPARVQKSGSHRRSAGKATQARVCQCFMFKVSVRNPYTKGLSTVATPYPPTPLPPTPDIQ